MAQKRIFLPTHDRMFVREVKKCGYVMTGVLGVDGPDLMEGVVQEMPGGKVSPVTGERMMATRYSAGEIVVFPDKVDNRVTGASVVLDGISYRALSPNDVIAVVKQADVQ